MMRPDKTAFRSLADFATSGIKRLAEEDPVLLDLIHREYLRQCNTLSMIAASSIADSGVHFCHGSVFGNLTLEGYPGHRFHSGCEYADMVENLAVERAMAVFGARYANVQPHSGSTANQILLFGFLKPGDRVLGLDLACGGHLTHGARASVSGQYFEASTYSVDENGFIDYNQVRERALQQRPRMIVCGASAYPRTIDFRLFREIADESGSLLLADISHIAGLVAAGCHPSPIDHAHFTTTSTYKQLYGPRGGMILMGRDCSQIMPGKREALSAIVQRSVFPLTQSTPDVGAIAAKARALAFVATEEFQKLASLIVENAQVLADEMIARGYRLVTGGTDNHMVLADLTSRELTGVVAQTVLEKNGILVNKNMIPNDTTGPLVTSGIRLGTNTLALRKMDKSAIRAACGLVDKVLSAVEPREGKQYDFPDGLAEAVRSDVEELCARYPIPGYQVTLQAGVASGGS
ncbi:MAG TPA: serine hydroxymethyltransferase [Candidatus Angelobacter sp.]|nr:serine hydroxymethyltransferase [Candidatus Angelobacter sp.]